MLEGVLGLMGERGVKNDFKFETKGEIEYMSLWHNRWDFTEA